MVDMMSMTRGFLSEGLPQDQINPDHQNSKPAKGFGARLLGRVQKVSERLRNASREDLVFAGLSVGAGLIAKPAVLAMFGFASGGATIAGAFVGAAAVAFSKAAINHVQNRRKGIKETSPFLTRACLQTVSSEALSVATLGASELFEYWSGQTVGQALGRALFNLAPFGNVHAADFPDIPVHPPHLDLESAPDDSGSGPESEAKSKPEPEPEPEPEQVPQISQAQTPRVANVSLTENAGNARIDDETRKKALEWAAARAKEAENARNLAEVDARIPSVAVINDEFKRAQDAVKEELPGGLDRRKIAAACLTDLPAANDDYKGQNNILPVRCTEVPAKGGIIDQGEYVTLRDINPGETGTSGTPETSRETQQPKRRGIRVLFANAKGSLYGFLGSAIGETAPAMGAEKLALESPAP